MYFCVVLCIVCFVTFPVLFVCICVLNKCHRVAIQLRLNIYHHIIYFGLRSLCSLQRMSLCDAPRGSTATCNFKTSALAESQWFLDPVALITHGSLEHPLHRYEQTPPRFWTWWWRANSSRSCYCESHSHCPPHHWRHVCCQQKFVKKLKLLLCLIKHQVTKAHETIEDKFQIFLWMSPKSQAGRGDEYNVWPSRKSTSIKRGDSMTCAYILYLSLSHSHTHTHTHTHTHAPWKQSAL
jgi:hypothetical protein